VSGRYLARGSEDRSRARGSPEARVPLARLPRQPPSLSRRLPLSPSLSLSRPQRTASELYVRTPGVTLRPRVLSRESRTVIFISAALQHDPSPSLRTPPRPRVHTRLG
jgi:hypothetical protein